MGQCQWPGQTTCRASLSCHGEIEVVLSTLNLDLPAVAKVTCHPKPQLPPWLPPSRRPGQQGVAQPLNALLPQWRVGLSHVLIVSDALEGCVDKVIT